MTQARNTSENLYSLKPWTEGNDAISVVSGEFLNPDTEKTYLESTWDDLNKRFKTTAFIALVFSMVSVYLDFRYLGYSLSFALLFLARFIGVIPLALLSVRSTVDHKREDILHSSFWAINCAFTSILASVYLLPEATLLSSMWICVMLMGNYTFVPHHFSRRVFSSLYVSLGFVAISMFHKDVSQEHFISALTMLTFTNAMGAQFSRALESFRRKESFLLQNLLPSNIIQSLKLKENPIEHYPQVSILFADLVGFTELASKLSPSQLVESLNRLFSEFDRISRVHKIQKVKTIGDCYMAAAGLPTADPDHAEKLIAAAIEMRRVVRRFIVGGKRLHLRIGIHSGSVVAGVIGIDRPFFDMWGDTVNIASRMESQGAPDQIQVSHATYQLTRGLYTFRARGKLEIKNGGDMATYFLNRAK